MQETEHENERLQEDNTVLQLLVLRLNQEMTTLRNSQSISPQPSNSSGSMSIGAFEKETLLPKQVTILPASHTNPNDDKTMQPNCKQTSNNPIDKTNGPGNNYTNAKAQRTSEQQSAAQQRGQSTTHTTYENPFMEHKPSDKNQAVGSTNVFSSSQNYNTGTNIRENLMPPRARAFTNGTPQPQISRRIKDTLYQSKMASSMANKPIKTTEKQQSALVKYVTSVPKAIFNGNTRTWPIFENMLRSFLRGHGISHTIEPGYLDSTEFDTTHNEALYIFLLSAVSHNPSVHGILQRAPNGDGHTAYCYLSTHYGVRDPSTLIAELTFFQPGDTETAFACALRLGTLYTDLAAAHKPHEDWEMVAKLLVLLEDLPAADFGAVASRIEDATNSRGITYEEAVTWIGHRQSILDSRASVLAIVPRARPVYKAAVDQQSSDINNEDESIHRHPSEMTNAELQDSIKDLTSSLSVFMATDHRHQPKSGLPPKECCPQTPGATLRRTAHPCRVDGCEQLSRSRLCEEHYLQLVSKKVKNLPCTTKGITKFAVYQENKPEGGKEWSGILIRETSNGE